MMSHQKKGIHPRPCGIINLSNIISYGRGTLPYLIDVEYAKFAGNTAEVFRLQLFRLMMMLFKVANFVFVAIWVSLFLCRITGYDIYPMHGELLECTYKTFVFLVLSIPAILTTPECKSLVKKNGLWLTSAVYIFAYTAWLFLILAFLM